MRGMKAIWDIHLMFLSCQNLSRLGSGSFLATVQSVASPENSHVSSLWKRSKNPNGVGLSAANVYIHKRLMQS